MRPFRELRVWRHAHELTLAVYRHGGGGTQQPVRSQQP